MRLSSYAHQWTLPGGTNSLILNGATGAMDLAPRNLALDLWRLAGPSAQPGAEASIPDAAVALLKERGYLTERREEEEVRLVERVLDVFASRVKGRLILNLPFEPGAKGFERLDELVETGLVRGRAEGQLVTILSDLSRAQSSNLEQVSTFLERVLDRAALFDLDMEIDIVPICISALREHVAVNHLQRIGLLLTGREQLDDSALSFTADLLRFGKRVEWLVRAQTWTRAELAEFMALKAHVVSLLHPSERFRAHNLLLVPMESTGAEHTMPEVISGEDLRVLRTLFRQTGAAAARRDPITLAPMSLAPLVEVSFPGTGAASVRVELVAAPNAGGWRELAAEGLDRIPALVAKAEAECGRLRALCGSRCPFALLCDRQCSAPADEGGVAYSGDFAARLERVLPALVANLLPLAA